MSAPTDVIRKMVRNRRRQLRDTSMADIPKWAPGMTTRAYVNLFAISHPEALPVNAPDRPAPWLTDDRVIVETD